MATIEIPGFELLEKIGAGGMATVWKARQVSLDRTVAVKILYSKFASDPVDIQRFQNEAQAAARLKHTGIVQVYDANALNGMYYFVMEYVAGYTVADWIRRKGVMPLADALLVADCVAEALEYAWNTAGIIHCDVKPDNVLIDADGSVKVSDLGLARTLSHMLEDEAQDEIMGTPAYIAPEQALGQAELDFRADIYALGAALYHMVTGKVPFGDKTPDEILDLQVNGTLPDPMDVNPDVPHQVAWLIEKMMCKDPAGRQPSWDAVRADFRRVKKGMRPDGEALPDGVSTVARSAHRSRPVVPGLDAIAKNPRGVAGRLASFALVLVVALGGYALLRAAQSGALNTWLEKVGLSFGSPLVAEAPPLPVPTWSEDLAKADAWVAQNPERYEEGIALYGRIANGAGLDPAGAAARARAEALRHAQKARWDAVIEALAAKADPLVAEGRLEEAAAVFADYTGDWSEPTASERTRRAEELRQQATLAAAATVEPARALDVILDDVLNALVSGNLSDALEAVDGAMADPGHASQADALQGLHDELEGALAADTRILNSFARQKGERIIVEMRKRPQELTVRDVRDGRVVAAIITGGTVEFDTRSLKAPERVKRLGNTTFPGSGIYMGLMAAEAGSLANAKKFFSQASPLVSERLLAWLSRNGR